MPGLFQPDGLDPKEATFYIGYWMTSMNRLHHLYRTPSEVFQAPYAAMVEGLYDGSRPEEDVFAALPATPTELLTPEYVQRLLHPDGALLDAMRDNDSTCRWRPRVPVRLYAAEGDRDVLFRNALHCQRDLHDGTPIVDLGDVDHTGSAIRAVPQVLDWFTRLT